MKTKTSLWFTICTLVLSIGIMFTGVYSILSVSMSMNASMGFNMHNATVTVQGTIQNVAQSTDNWQTASPTTLTLERTIMGGDEQTTTNLSLGDLYFYTGSNMIFTFTFINISETAIQATFPMPTVGDGVTILEGKENGYTDFADDVYITNIVKNSSKTITFALTMDNPIQGINVSFAWNNIQFEQIANSAYFYTISDGSSSDNYLATTIGTYVHNNVHYEVEWLAFAVKGTGETFSTRPSFVPETAYSITIDNNNDDTVDETWYSLNGVDMRNIEYNNHTFWFVQRDLFIEKSYNTEGTLELEAEVYAESGIHSYLQYNYLTDINFTGYDLYKNNAITKRTVTDENQTPFSASTLWLLSRNEVYLLIGSTDGSDPKEPFKVPAKFFNTYGWWLRSLSNKGQIDYISPASGMLSYSNDPYWPGLAVRPAFEITINE